MEVLINCEIIYQQTILVRINCLQNCYIILRGKKIASYNKRNARTCLAIKITLSYEGCCQDNLIFRQPNKGRLAIPIQVPYIEELYSLVLLIHVSYLFAH